MRPATILMLLTNTYDPDPRVRQEALALLEMGCRVRLLAWDRDVRSPVSEVLEGIEIQRVQLRSLHGRGATQIAFYVLLYIRMLWMGWRIPFDAVHCHDLDTLPLGFILGKLKRKPVVYDAHESFPDMLAGSVPAPLRHMLGRLENFLIRRIDLLITVGEKIRRNFEKRGARRTVTVGNWKRLDEYDRSRQQNLETRKRLGIPDDALAVACITQLLKDRQIEELLDAVDSSAGVYAIVGGKGVLQDYIQNRAAKNPHIIFVGFVRGNEIPAYTCAADVIYYGFDPQNPNARYSAPNKLYEAVAAGRPLLTGDFGEIGDVVRNVDCGIVLERYSPEAVRKALAEMQNAARRESWAENARRYGRTAMNWTRGREILFREYSALLPQVGREAVRCND